MSENTELNPGAGGDIVAADDIAGVKYQRVKLTLGADGANDGDVSSNNPVPVSGAFYPATQPVSGTVEVSNFPAPIALTDAQLRATPLSVSGTFYQDSQPVSAAALPLPAGAATDATVQAIQTLNDTMLYMLSAMLEKMPRVNGNDQAAVSVETGTVAIGSGTVTAVTTVGSVTNMVSVGGKQAAQMPDAISQLGALHLYQNITVS